MFSAAFLGNKRPDETIWLVSLSLRHYSEFLESAIKRGISRANRDRVFDSFFTTRRESGGAGMGLAIVRAMLEAHGGRIELLGDESDQAPGAAFALTIPAARS